MSTIHVARNGAPLGIFSSEEIKTGLGNGQFILSDLAWQAGMAQWTLLQEWPEFAPQNGVPPLLTAPPPIAPAPDAPPVPEPAWERRETVGTWKAFWQTVRDVLFAPTKVFSALSTEPSFSKAFVFYIVALVPFCILQRLAALPFPQSNSDALLELSQKDPAAYEKLVQALSPEVLSFLSEPAGGNPIYAVPLGVCFSIFGFFIFGGLIHLALLLVGGAKRPLATTLKTFSYVNGALWPIGWVPFIGPVVVLVWGLVLQVIALTHAQETTIGKTVSALLLTFVFFCCACGALSAIVLSLAFSTAAAAGALPAPQ